MSGDQVRGHHGEDGMIVGTWPEDAGGPVFIRGYHDRSYEGLIAAYYEDAVLLLRQGYEPIGQHYIEGQLGWLRPLIATLLIPVAIGVLMWGLLLLERPVGTLTVTYVRRGATK
jgi:hypothetical protein